MKESDSLIEHRLEEALYNMGQRPVFNEEGEKNEPQDHLEKMSRLFSELLSEGGLSDPSIKTLNVVIPGASFYEVAGMLVAAEALGIPKTQITTIERTDESYLFLVDRLSKIFDKPVTQINSTLTIGENTLSLYSGDAGDAEYTEKLPDADASMVFIGNSLPTHMERVFGTWSQLGKRTNKPFLFAITCTDLAGEKKKISKLFEKSKVDGELTGLSGFDGVPNRYAFSGTKWERFFNHANIFAAVRR